MRTTATLLSALTLSAAAMAQNTPDNTTQRLGAAAYAWQFDEYGLVPGSAISIFGEESELELSFYSLPDYGSSANATQTFIGQTVGYICGMGGYLYDDKADLTLTAESLTGTNSGAFTFAYSDLKKFFDSEESKYLYRKITQESFTLGSNTISIDANPLTIYPSVSVPAANDAFETVIATAAPKANAIKFSKSDFFSGSGAPLYADNAVLRFYFLVVAYGNESEVTDAYASTAGLAWINGLRKGTYSTDSYKMKESDPSVNTPGLHYVEFTFGDIKESLSLISQHIGADCCTTPLYTYAKDSNGNLVDSYGQSLGFQNYYDILDIETQNRVVLSSCLYATPLRISLIDKAKEEEFLNNQGGTTDPNPEPEPEPEPNDPSLTTIGSTQAEALRTTYTDLQGRETERPTRGIYVRSRQMTDGSEHHDLISVQ